MLCESIQGCTGSVWTVCCVHSTLILLGPNDQPPNSAKCFLNWKILVFWYKSCIYQSVLGTTAVSAGPSHKDPAMSFQWWDALLSVFRWKVGHFECLLIREIQKTNFILCIYAFSDLHVVVSLAASLALTVSFTVSEETTCFTLPRPIIHRFILRSHTPTSCFIPDATFWRNWSLHIKESNYQTCHFDTRSLGCLCPFAKSFVRQESAVSLQL